MASKSPQTSRMLVLSAVFISLSGPVLCGECYWCGPLSEQVHRSQRAPPCSAPLETTACEPGLNYCATVATAPPYVESRYCVKLYQDECYPLFCNSTRTWRMICACRGDLCNGPNTDREKEAFTVLNKLVTKQRNKRSVTSNFVNPSSSRLNDVTITNNTAQEDNMTLNESVPSDQQMNGVEMETPTTENDNSVTQPESEATNVPETASDGHEQAENVANIENINAEIKVDVQQIATTIKELTVDTATTTKLEVVQSDAATSLVNTSPKGQLPTAEALQHHVSPQIKQTEAIVIETTTTTDDATLKPTSPSKNIGVSVHTQITIIRIVAIISLFL